MGTRKGQKMATLIDCNVKANFSLRFQKTTGNLFDKPYIFKRT